MKINIILMALCLTVSIFVANVMNAQTVTPRAAFVSTYSSLSDLQTNGDDDEYAAAAWFVNTYGGEFLPVSQIGTVDLSAYNVLWITIDRVGIGDGLPTELTETSVLTAIKNYYQSGGNLLLTNHATRYLVNLERTTRFPSIKGDGTGNNNTENWGANSIIGSSYDHSGDFLYAGMTPDITEGTAKKVYNLIGSGDKEDHNSMWDLNTFGYNGNPNIVINFETENNATVLGTWQQVTDYCCAGIVRFNPTDTYQGKSIAIGLAAYEWNQNSGTNTYQGNIQILTKNALDELGGAPVVSVTFGTTHPDVAFFSTFSSYNALIASGDDDEAAAATWFVNTYGGTFLPATALGNTNLTQFKAIWIAVDRVGIGSGLPGELTATTILNKIKTYYQAGGNLLLTNHATRYLVNLGRTTRFPSILGDGAGGSNTDDWGANSIIGSNYDHSGDFLYAGMTPDITDGTQKKVYNLIGSGNKEDHNSMWDLNTFSYDGNPNIVVNFETENNATVLGTWQHVVDYCCAGIVRFNPTDIYQGESIAIGLAAYEWNQNSGTNTYQGNIIKLTENALAELAPVKNTIISENTTLENLLIGQDDVVAINEGIQLTVTGALVNAGTLTLKSDAINGTATILTPDEISGTGIANVEQYLAGKTGASGREWWYISSPVSGAKTTLFNTNGNRIGYYDEATTSYTDPIAAEENLAVGRGYVLNLAGDDAVYTFTGALNNGKVSVPVSRTGTTAAKRGFNLVGNPYPSYLDWDAVTKTNVQSTIWTRTFENQEMVFKTYNADAQVGSDDQTTAHITPLQAFWVKVLEEKANVSDLTLDFTNAQRLHKDDSDGSLRTAQSETQAIVRLEVSNGTNKDQTVLVFNENAGSGFNSYDSEKISNEIPAVPEIYTLEGSEKLVINSLSAIPQSSEITLGFNTGTAGSFTIQATTISNIDSKLQIIFKDKIQGVDFDLTNGETYTFTSDATNTESRFAIVFVPQVTTGILGNTAEKLQAYVNNGKLLINNGKLGDKVTVFNLTGQKLCEETLNGKECIVKRTFAQGVYLVKVGNETAKVIVR